jgi:hypothetical protein
MMTSFLFSNCAVSQRSTSRLWSILSAGLGFAGAIALTTAPALADEQFDNSGIVFQEDTIVEFEFVESNGAYQSVFGVVNQLTGERTPLFLETKPSNTPQSIEAPSTYQDDFGANLPNDFLGTPGDTILDALAEFEFKANTPYSFYLDSSFGGQSGGVISSLDNENPRSERLVVFDGGLEGLAGGGVMLRWDDTGALLVRSNQQDRDFDDFVIQAGGQLACPYNQVSQNESAPSATVAQAPRC